MPMFPKHFLSRQFRVEVPRGTHLAMGSRQVNAGGADGERLIANLDEDTKSRTTVFP